VVAVRAARILACIAAACACAPSAIAAPPYAGRALEEALRDVAGNALRLVYNSELVPPDARVAREPPAGAVEAVLAALLAPHGLRLERVGPSTYAVVRVPETPPAPAAALPPGALDAIVVTASRYDLAAEFPAAHTFLTDAQIEALPKLADEPLRAVHRLPGAASNGLSGLAHLRGGEENETQILLDGMPLYEPFHLRNFLSPVSLLDAAIVGSLDVYTGGFPAQYGERMSAVVDVRTRTPAAPREWQVGANLFHASATSAGTFGGGHGSWLAALRRSHVSTYAELANSAIGEPAYRDGFAKAQYEVGPRTQVSLTLLRAADEIAIGDDFEAANARYDNEYAWATVQHRWSEHASGTVIASYTEVGSRRRGTLDDPAGRTGRIDDAREYRAWGLKADAVVERGHVLWRVGGEARDLAATFDYAALLVYRAGQPFPASAARSESRALALSPRGTQYAAYVAARWQPAPAFTAESGLRFESQDYETVDADALFSPRVSLRWDMAAGWRLRGSLGRFRQAQGINELQVEDGVQRYFPAQRADHAVLGLEREFDDGLTLRVEAYSKRYRSLRPRYENLWNPLALLPELAPDRARIAPTSARADGMEFLATWAPEASAWRGWLGYTLARVRDRVDGVDLPRAWDQRHALSTGADATVGAWDLALAATVHQGWPTTPVRLDAASGAVAIGARNSARLGTYASVDVRAGRRIAVGAGTLRVYGEVTNVLARRNPCCRRYTVEPDANAWRLDVDERIWPRIVPSVGFAYEW
jgi:outer membrane cobalamin receptor